MPMLIVQLKERIATLEAQVEYLEAQVKVLLLMIEAKESDNVRTKDED